MLAILFSSDNNNEGSKIKLANIASNKVADTNEPKATVPPKLEITNTEKPKNNTIDVLPAGGSVTYSEVQNIQFFLHLEDFLISPPWNEEEAGLSPSLFYMNCTGDHNP